MRIRLIKTLDAIVGRLAVALLPGPAVASMPTKIETILFIRPGGIGDAVHLIPAINALKASYPDITIDILAEKRNSAVFGFCPNVGTLFHYEIPIGLFRALCKTYDIVIDTEQWHRLSAVVARMTRAPIVLGFGTNERTRLFTHTIDYSHGDHEIKSFLKLLASLSMAPMEIGVPFLTLPRQAAASAESLLHDVDGRPFVVIFPGASIPERRWGAEKFRGVAGLLHAKGLPVVVVGGREDVAEGQQIVSGVSGFNLAGKTSLAETAAVIARSALLVSGDSGILHIGVGLGKPTVSLFGPGVAKKWAPRGENHIVINKNLPCSPCTKFGYTPQCPINARCMAEISVEEVTAAVLDLFEKHGKRT